MSGSPFSPDPGGRSPWDPLIGLVIVLAVFALLRWAALTWLAP